jgi:hypothetical protein
MGHHHHKHRSTSDTPVLTEAQNINYNPNPNQNQIPNSSPNPGQNQDMNPGGNFNMGPFADLFKNVDMNQISSLLSGFNPNAPNAQPDMNMNEADRGTYIINALKSFLPDERGRVLDEILRLYSLSKTISSQ